MVCSSFRLLSAVCGVLLSDVLTLWTKIDFGDIVGRCGCWFQIYLFSETRVNKASICWGENHPCVGVVMSSLGSVLTTLCLQDRAAFSVPSKWDLCGRAFYILITCCLWPAPEYAQKDLITETWSENSFQPSFFPILVLSKMAGRAGVGGLSGKFQP